MKLSEFLVTNSLTPKAFGDRIGVTAEAVRLWTTGARRPRDKELMDKIKEATGGAVQPNDFFSDPEPTHNEAGAA